MLRLGFIKDRKGAISILAAFSSVLILGFAALAVDLGSIFLQTRKLQGIADLAAIAAARDLGNAQAAAQATAQANGWKGPIKVLVVTGTYAPDASLPSGKRFVAGAAPVDAVQVTLGAQADLFFGQAITGKSSESISRTATAAQAQLATFSLGTRLAALNGGVANAALSALTGSQVSLSVMDYNALTTANVDLLQYSQALATHMSLQGASFDKVLSSKVSEGDALSVMASVLSTNNQDPAAAAMRKLAAAASTSTPAQLDRLIDLGPYADQDHVSGGTGAGVAVNAMDMANAILQLAQEGRQVKMDVGANVPGLADVTIWLAIGERPNKSPWLTVAKDGSEVIRTAQTRLYIDSKVAPGGVLGGLGVAQVDLPVLVEAAEADAKLGSIDCTAQSARLLVRPSVGSVNIGQIDVSQLNNFKQPLNVQPANLVSALFVHASGSSREKLGGVNWQSVSFSHADIASGVVKTVSTEDLAQASVGSLIGNMKLSVSVGPLALGVGQLGVTNALGGVLTTAATPVDGLLNSLEDLLGIHIGQADTRVNGLRCRDAALVA